MQKTVCPLLWNHSFISTTNEIAPCCRARNEDVSDEWKQAQITDGITSKAHIKSREQMRNGEWPRACTVCKISESKFGKSPRLSLVNEHDIDYSKEPQPNDIRSIDVKFNNTCNLECVMCNASSSSSIASFVEKHIDLAPPSMKRNLENDWQEQEKLDWCKTIIAHKRLETFKTTGGEPFAQKHFWALIDWCIEQRHTYFEIKITTNGTKFNKRFLEKLSKFKSVHICISCDGTDSVYEYIRHKGKWDSFVNNVKLFTDYVKLHPNTFQKPNLHCVLQAYNCHNITELYNFAELYNFNFTIDCFIHPKNSVFALDSVPLRIRKKLVKKLQYTEHEYLKKYVYMMQNYRHDKFKTKKLFTQTINLDKARNTNYKCLQLPFELT